MYNEFSYNNLQFYLQNSVKLPSKLATDSFSDSQKVSLTVM